MTKDASEKQNEMSPNDMPKTPKLSWREPQNNIGNNIDVSLAPLDEMFSLRRRLKKGNALASQEMFSESDLDILADDPIFQQLSASVFTGYSMEPTAINFLKEMISKYKPSAVLELGSGLTTAILSRHLNDIHKGTGIKPKYVSVDQSRDYLDETNVMLKKVKVSNYVDLVHMDIEPFRVQGQSIHSCYDFNEEKLHKAFEGTRPDFVIIDGPVGAERPFARLLTLPLARVYASKKALFFLDDALRDVELETMRAWQAFNDFEVLGIKCVSKGVMVGKNVS